jgi:L-alanine-DL-glutamate epimerase-like enolase superfamily enzyme
MEYAAALEPLGLWWFEEPGDPLDYELLRVVGESYAGALATGENLFSLPDARNLVRYGGLRPDLDIIQIDPSLSYGVPEYVRILDELRREGWSARRCIPHGGHQLNLHMAAAFGLGGIESYPGVFRPIGGFGDATPVEDGHIRLPDVPGIGIEANAELSALFEEMVGAT